MTRVIRGVGLVLVVAITIAACGIPRDAGDRSSANTTTTLTTTAAPSTTPSTLPTIDHGLYSTCGYGELVWPYSEATLGLEPFEGDIHEYASEDIREEWDFFNTDVEWWVVEETTETMTLLGVDETSPSELGRHSTLKLRMIDGEWQVRGWGGCNLQAGKDGYGIATFVLDRNNPPAPGSSSIHVLATERACASGQAPSGREVTSTVLETEDFVDIVVFVESFTGSGVQTCQGNPSFAFEVQLDSLLGVRIIRDVSLYPITEHPWPPPLPDGRLNIYLDGTAPRPETANVFGWTDPIAGALVFTSSSWAEWIDGVTWIQEMPGIPRTVYGFVADCSGGGCDVEECEGPACDEIPRIGLECTFDYLSVSGKVAEVVIDFHGDACSIEVTEVNIEE